MATVKNKFTGDAAQLERELERMRQAMAKVEDKLGDVTEKSKRSNQEGSDLFGQMHQNAERSIASLAKQAAAFLSISLAVSKVNEGLQRKQELERAAVDAAKTTAQRRDEAIIMMGNAPTEEKQRFFDDMRNLATKVGFNDEDALYESMGKILSGTAGDMGRTKRIMEIALPMFRNSPDSMATFGGAVGDIARLGGGDLSEKEAIGLLFGTMGQARITELASMKEIAGSASAVVNNAGAGLDRVELLRQSSALFSAIGADAGDTTGSVTKSTIVALSKALGDAVGNDKLPFEQLAELRNNPELRDQVLAAGGPAEQRATLKNLLSGGSVLDAVMSSYGQIQTSPEYVDKLQSEIDTLQMQEIVSRQEDRMQAAATRATEEQNLTPKGRARKLFQDYLWETSSGMEAATWYPIWSAGNTAMQSFQSDEDYIRGMAQEAQANARNATGANAAGWQELNRSLMEILDELKNQNAPRMNPGQHEETD